MATVEDQENEHRGEEVSSTGKEAHASGCDRRAFPRGSNNVGGCQASGNARQLNLPPFHDEQSRLDMAAVVVDLALSWAPKHVQWIVTPTGSIIPRAARYMPEQCDHLIVKIPAITVRLDY